MSVVGGGGSGGAGSDDVASVLCDDLGGGGGGDGDLCDLDLEAIFSFLALSSHSLVSSLPTLCHLPPPPPTMLQDSSSCFVVIQLWSSALDAEGNLFLVVVVLLPLVEKLPLLLPGRELLFCPFVSLFPILA